MPPPKIVERGRQFVGYQIDEMDDTKGTLTFQIWCTTDTGHRYSRYVDITIPNSKVIPDTWTAEETKAFETKLNQENREQLDRAQADLERIEATTWEVPERNWDAVREHTEGPCRCGLTHPPHLPWQLDDAPVCWCGERHQGWFRP